MGLLDELTPACTYCFDMALVFLSCILSATVAHPLSVLPPFLSESEGDTETFFFCTENNNTFATDIFWQDPQQNNYTPGSLTKNENKRISAEGSRLSIQNIIRNDSGIYRCLRRNNTTEFGEGKLTVLGMHASYVLCAKRYIYTTCPVPPHCKVVASHTVASV